MMAGIMITATRTEGSALQGNLNYGYIWLISLVAALGTLWAECELARGAHIVAA